MTMMPEVARSVHTVTAGRLFQPLYRMYRMARPAWRAATRQYYSGLRFRKQALSWSDDQRRKWVLHQLRYAVGRAWRETQYYKEVFAQVGFDPQSDFDFKDFAALPVLERSAVHSRGTEMVSTTVPRELVRKDATGGSTGTPTEIWMGPEERGWRESGIEHFMGRIGLSPGSRIALLWGHHLDPVGRQKLIERLRDWVDNVRWFDCLRLSPGVLERYHVELRRWKPHAVVAYASSLAQLAEQVARHGDQPNYPTRCFVAGAEKLLPDQRSLIEAVFRRPVFERYGSRDVGLMGAQVGGSGTAYEMDWSNVLVEPETSDPNSPILVTKLHADAMPMIRYRIGDLGRFPTGSEPGMPTFTLHAVLGREVDRIWLPDGRWVHGLGLPHLMKDHPVRDFQVVQSVDLDVIVKVVPNPEFDDSSSARILHLLRANLPGINVDLMLVDEIERTPSNKRRPVLSAVGNISLKH